MEDYINCPSPSSSNDKDTRRMEKQSRDSVLGVCRGVVLAFGLLCILQATLNISLRLLKTFPTTADACSNISDHCVHDTTTTDWIIEDMVAMRFNLIKQRKELQSRLDMRDTEYRDCIQNLFKKQISPFDCNKFTEEFNVLDKDRDTLRDQVSQQRNVIQELERQRDRLLMQIYRLDPTIPRCPLYWIMEQSRCYLLSSNQSTWDLAKQDCLNRGAHLVTVDSHDKQVLVQTVGLLVDRVWIGLRTDGGGGLSTWEDGTPLYKTRRQTRPKEDATKESCFYVDQQQTDPMHAWVDSSCEELNYWLCVKPPVDKVHLKG